MHLSIEIFEPTNIKTVVARAPREATQGGSADGLEGPVTFNGNKMMTLLSI